MTVVRKCDSYQGGVKGIQKVWDSLPGNVIQIPKSHLLISIKTNKMTGNNIFLKLT